MTSNIPTPVEGSSATAHDLLEDRKIGDRGVYMYDSKLGDSVEVKKGANGLIVVIDAPHNNEIHGQQLSVDQIPIIDWN